MELPIPFMDDHLAVAMVLWPNQSYYYTALALVHFTTEAR